MRIELDIVHIANKKAQSSTGGENIRCGLDCINLTFASTVILGHNDLLPFGFALNQKTIGKISFRFDKIPQRVDFLNHKIAQIRYNLNLAKDLETVGTKVIYVRIEKLRPKILSRIEGIQVDLRYAK